MSIDESIREIARRALERCDILARHTETPGKITRTFLSRPMLDVHRDVAQWVKAVGMSVRVDGVGNIVGRYEGARPDAPALLIGSHLDTVPDAGRYDGILGVMLGIGVVEALAGERLPIAIEVVGFSEEEGARFAKPYIGSEGFIGRLSQETLELQDRGGLTVRDAIAAFGLDHRNVSFDPLRYVGYVEAHIEQGPVLESLGLPLGVVTAIVGQTRYTIEITGEARHAGTTPMDKRKDALIAASEFVIRAAKIAELYPGIVATVGSLRVEPGASNVIPGRVVLTLDVRGENHIDRNAVLEIILGLPYDRHEDSYHDTIPMNARLTALLESCLASAPHRLASGAGHDAAILASVMPAAMLFIRSPGGISHHPDESVIAEDVALALRTMVHFVRALASRES